MIHSRMRVGMSKYDKEYKDADVILFEPSRDDADLFFTNMFSYSGRKRLSEHAYRRTRAELLRRYDELSPRLARHGVTIDRECLLDSQRSLTRAMAGLNRGRARALGEAALQLSDALDNLGYALKRRQTSKSGLAG
jgi:hypothetical protein